MATTTQVLLDDSMADQLLFTCLSCSIAFPSAEDQRTFKPLLCSDEAVSLTIFGNAGVHYRSDHHRYNMKRRVASLPPVSATVFNQKVLDRKVETSVMSSTKGSACDVCGCVEVFVLGLIPMLIVMLRLRMQEDIHNRKRLPVTHQLQEAQGERAQRCRAAPHRGGH